MRNGKGVHGHLFAVLSVAAIVVLAVTGSAFADATWTQTINVAEAGGTNVDLQFGVNPAATDGTDNGVGGTTDLGEVEQPPLPPSGNFDARFSTNLVLDLRAGTAPQAEHTWTVQFQRAAGGNITLTWDAASLATKVTSATMKDAFGGVLGIDLDMTTTGTVEISNAAITSVVITATSVATYVPHTAIVVTTQPSTGTSGQTLGNLQIKAQDAGGNGAQGVSITVAVGTGTGSLAGTLTQTTDATGVATFGDLVYTTGTGASDPENMTITASAKDYQGNDISVTTSNISIAQPVLGVPVLTDVPAAVEGTNENQRPTLSWGAALNAVSYELSLGSNAGCDNILADVAVTSTSYQPASRLADGSYCWKVRSVDADGNKSAYSATSTFDTIPTFGEWGLIFLIASMVGCGGWYLRRRAGSRA